MSVIKKELMEATSLKQKKAEDETDFLNRLIPAINEMEDADFDKLSSAAQTWANKAIKAFQADKPPPAWPDADEGSKSPEEKPAKAKAEKAPAKKAKVDDEDEPVAKPKKAAKDEDEEKPAKKPKKEGNAATYKVKEYMLDHPEMTASEIFDKIGEKLGTTKLTVWSAYSSFRHSVRVLQDKGLLPKKVLAAPTK